MPVVQMNNCSKEQQFKRTIVGVVQIENPPFSATSSLWPLFDICCDYLFIISLSFYPSIGRSQDANQFLKFREICFNFLIRESKFVNNMNSDFSGSYQSSLCLLVPKKPATSRDQSHQVEIGQVRSGYVRLPNWSKHGQSPRSCSVSLGRVRLSYLTGLILVLT